MPNTDFIRSERALTMGSGCKLAFIKRENLIIPVLVLIGINKQGVDGERVSSENALGKVGIIISEQDVQSKNIITKFKLTPVEINDTDWMNLQYGVDKVVYPRIFIKSLNVRTDTNSLVLNYEDYGVLQLNNKIISYTTLKPYEDYSVLTRSLDEQYVVTLNPDLVISKGAVGSYTGAIQPRQVTINYSISNADTSIYLDALEIAKENSMPKVSYDVKPNIYNSKYCEALYNNLGNIVRINDSDLKFKNVRGYISGITLDLDSPDNDSIEIKNYKTKFEDLFSTITAQTELMRKNNNLMESVAAAFTSSGDLSEQVLQSSITKVDLNYAFNNGKLTIDLHNGIWGTSDTGVVAFRGGGIFTSTERDGLGNWKWNTGITPEGINAGLITTGQLDTNLIKIYSGDNLRFQMNGDGIFAYKSVISDAIATDLKHPGYTLSLQDLLDYQNLQQILNRTEKQEKRYQKLNDIIYRKAKNSIDGKQYVLFNDDGLALIAKKGARVLNRNKTGYIEVLSDELTTKDPELLRVLEIKRVEVSWDGFILRNWKNKPVFYADPLSGDLTLEGTINATGGSIGAWNFDGHKLWADSAVNEEGVYTTFVAINAGGLSQEDEQGHWDPIKKGNGEFYKDNNGNNLYIKIKDYCFWAGGINPNNAPFSIQKNGLFHAASGDVGGWSIASDKLSSSLISLATTTNKISAQTRQASTNTSYLTGTSEENINTNTISTTDSNSTTYAVIWGHSYTDDNKTTTTDAVNKASFYISDEGKIYANDFSFIHYNTDKTISYTLPITNLIDVAQRTADNAYNKAIKAWNKAVAAYNLASQDSGGIKRINFFKSGNNIALQYYDTMWHTLYVPIS